jgi:hypothetical protein
MGDGREILRAGAFGGTYFRNLKVRDTFLLCGECD